MQTAVGKLDGLGSGGTPDTVRVSVWCGKGGWR